MTSKHNPSSLSLIFLTKEHTCHRQTQGGFMRSCLSAIIPSLAAALLLTAPAFAAPAQPAKEAAVPVQTAATSSYSGNAKTRIFHVSGCRYFNCKACTVRFKSAEEARSNGYKPCKRCLAREGR